MADKTIQIRIRFEPEPGSTSPPREEVIEVGKQPIIIGSHPDCQIRIEHASVSSQHANLRFKDGELTILALPGGGGILVNEKERNGNRSEVEFGDKVKVGDVTFQVLKEDPLEVVEEREERPGSSPASTPPPRRKAPLEEEEDVVMSDKAPEAAGEHEIGRAPDHTTEPVDVVRIDEAELTLPPPAEEPPPLPPVAAPEPPPPVTPAASVTSPSPPPRVAVVPTVGVPAAKPATKQDWTAVIVTVGLAGLALLTLVIVWTGLWQWGHEKPLLAVAQEDGAVEAKPPKPTRVRKCRPACEVQTDCREVKRWEWPFSKVEKKEKDYDCSGLTAIPLNPQGLEDRSDCLWCWWEMIPPTP